LGLELELDVIFGASRVDVVSGNS